MNLEGAAERQDGSELTLTRETGQSSSQSFRSGEFVEAGFREIQHVDPRNARGGELLGHHLHHQRVDDEMQVGRVPSIHRQAGGGPTISNAGTRVSRVRRTDLGPQAERQALRVDGEGFRGPAQARLKHGKRPEPARGLDRCVAVQLLLQALSQSWDHRADFPFDLRLAGIQTADHARLDLMPGELVSGELDVAGPLDIPIIVRNREAGLPQSELQLAGLHSRFEENLERDGTTVADHDAEGRCLRCKPPCFQNRFADPQFQAQTQIQLNVGCRQAGELRRIEIDRVGQLAEDNLIRLPLQVE